MAGPVSSARIFVVVVASTLVGCGARTGLEVAPCSVDGGECCAPREEVCNGLDDDCDGAPDDGLSCFSLDGELIAAQQTNRCGVAWYSYDSPDPQSANPTPDIRVPDGTVVAFQTGPSCGGASLAVITDVPMDSSGGDLLAEWLVSPPSAGELLVSDEPDECVHDRLSGQGACDFAWMPCCTDGVLLGTFTGDACIRMTLSGAVGVAPPVILDGETRAIERRYGEPFVLCAQIRPAVP